MKIIFHYDTSHTNHKNVGLNDEVWKELELKLMETVC